MVLANARWASMMARVSASLIGVWAFTWAFVALGITLFVAAGLPYDEAQTLLHLVAFLLFLGLFLWAYGAASVGRVWCVLAGGSVAMAATAWALVGLLA